MTVHERPILFSGAMVRALLAGKKSQTRRVMNPQPTPCYHTRPVGNASDPPTRDPVSPYVPDGVWVPYRAARAMVCYHPGHEHDGGPGGRCLEPGAGLAGCDERDLLPHVCSFGPVGTRLWVRESWASYGDPDAVGTDFIYRADGPRELTEADHVLGARRWRPSIHMPRAASRILLEVTGVRVERVQAISEEDAKAEGVPTNGHGFLGPYRDGRFGYSEERLGEYASAREAFSARWDMLNERRGFGWSANPWVWVVEFRRVVR